MSWIISRALMNSFENSHCSQGLAAESSGESYLDGVPCAPSKLSPTPQAFCAPDRMTEFSRLSQFGMTFAPLTGNLGADLLTWYLEGSRVRTSAPQEDTPELKGPAVDFGQNLQGSFAKYDPNTCLWKIPHCLFQEGLPSCLATLPNWGMMRNGELSELTTSAGPIAANAAGFSLPTPLKSDGSKQQMTCKVKHLRKSKFGARIHSIPYWLLKKFNIRCSPKISEWAMGWPLGWSSLAPLAMDKFLLWLQQHGKHFPPDCNTLKIPLDTKAHGQGPLKRINSARKGV